MLGIPVSPYLPSLPEEIILKILGYGDCNTILACKRVSCMVMTLIHTSLIVWLQDLQTYVRRHLQICLSTLFARACSQWHETRILFLPWENAVPRHARST
jgi:hypothetical protein